MAEPPSGAEVNNGCSFTYILPHVISFREQEMFPFLLEN